jgi:Zn-finger nucleic acid-binding protein
MQSKKPSEAEEEFFAREEAEKKRKFALSQVKALADADRQKLQQAHHMRCPKCGMQLTELALGGVMVDRCFGCHGMFLDADDIKKLMGHEGYWSRMLHFFARKDYSHDHDNK